VGLGVSLGVIVATVAVRFVDRLLFQVGRTDPLVFGTVTAALILAGLVACMLPAREATRVDPTVALRSEM
jgi:putative ABC transport system permease protein